MSGHFRPARSDSTLVDDTIRGWRMNERSAARLYITDIPAPGGMAELSAGQMHHLRSVLRLGPGAAVAAFNAADGEWLCRIAEIGKAGASLSIERRLRPPVPEPD